MPFAHSFTGVTPPARYDGLPWTHILIEEATAATGPWTLIDSQTVPVDATPETPNPVNVTTTAATVATGWFRLRFRDAANALSGYTVPILSPSTASGTPLTTLERVRRFLQLQPGDTDQDATIVELIDSASRVIIDEYQREFAGGPTAAARTFEFDREAPYVSLEPYDLRTLTSVTLAGVTLTNGTDFRTRPLPARHGVTTGLLVQNTTSTRTADRYAPLVVTGDWGFATIPSDVEHWATVTVATWLRRDVAAFNATFSIAEDRVERPRALPDAARAGLEHYRRFYA
ncbi:hypothetical protein [Paraconexibacter algicola]|uniref:Uncharacterized protein n=1 Tax=Paraconexibacter algicola TaxID=2133960 RepID=A0A2T4UE30_9ACTN|nr:hypothetical protein [Paraconexibacter algicola]PTL55751.1 hypothetical protein C7Y72_19165 [Paraconexibacter algicola]